MCVRYIETAPVPSYFQDSHIACVFLVGQDRFYRPLAPLVLSLRSFDVHFCQLFDYRSLALSVQIPFVYLLDNSIGETKTKLETLKTASEQANTALANGEISQEQFDALQREIIETTEELKRLEEGQR